MHPIFAPQFRKPMGPFGRLAASYMIKRNAFVYPEIDRFAEFEDGQSVLEIGYGPGIGLGYFLDRHDIGLDGIDFSPLMWKSASRRNRASIKDGRLRLFLGDVLKDRNGLRSYDRVVFSNVVYFWDDPDDAFEKIRSMIKPGGKLVFYMSEKSRLEKMPLTSSPAFHHYDSAELLASLERVGFKNPEKIAIVDDSGDFLILRADA